MLERENLNDNLGAEDTLVLRDVENSDAVLAKGHVVVETVLPDDPALVE